MDGFYDQKFVRLVKFVFDYVREAAHLELGTS